MLEQPALVINKNWSPITFLPVKICITTVMRDMASVLDTENYLLLDFEQWTQYTPKIPRWIKTASGQLAAPDIIVLKKFGERPPSKVNLTKLNLARRDMWCCQYCGVPLDSSGLTMDHVYPRSRGGKMSWDNIVAACEDCNVYKADRTPDEANMLLKKKPIEPSWNSRLRAPENIMLESWKPFLSKEHRN